MKLILQAIKSLFRKVENAIPEKLPNPNAITFTGAVEATYDGSQPVEVEIPEGGGGGAYHIVSNTYTGEISIADGTYDALKDALENCKYVNFVCVIGNTNPDSEKVLNSYLPNSLRLDADDVVRGYCNNSSHTFYINPDNTGNLYYDD